MRAAVLLVALALAGCVEAPPPRRSPPPPASTETTPDPIEGAEDVLAIRLVDDDVDLMPRPPSEDDDWPPTMMWLAEHVPVGPSEEVTRHYLELPIAKGATIEQTRQRLARYVARLPTPKGDVIGFYVRPGGVNGDNGGVRTVVVGARVLGPRDFAEPIKLEWKGDLVVLKEESVPKFFTALDRAPNRRMVLLFDGLILEPPQVLPRAKRFYLE